VAKPVSKITLGIDVAKDQHIICNWTTEAITTLPNQPREIKRWLSTLPVPVRIAIEPTSHYHLLLVEEALALGHQVYLINPRQLVYYRQAVNLRHKTDPQDAWLLARFLEHEAEQLRPFQPQDRRAQQLWALLKRRATLVQCRQRVQQSFRHTNMTIKGLLSSHNQLLLRLDRRIQHLIRELGWWPDYQRCLSIPGIGPANAAAMVAAYHRGAFSGSDAFVAYLGMDVRMRDSGHFKGKRKLTKQGPSELRRLLYCASKAACCYHRFADYRQQLLDKGMSKIAARVALARKLARIAFTLMARQESFIQKENAYCTGP
jgi:transposase